MRMSEDEIVIPKEVREFMPDWAEETVLGFPHGSNKQYRYGNLHIREYDNEYRVHVDVVDPRKDKLGHLVHDAPAVLVGAGCALAAGIISYKLSGNKPNYSRPGRAARIAVSAALSGYTAYKIAEDVMENKRQSRQNRMGDKDDYDGATRNYDGQSKRDGNSNQRPTAKKG